MGSRHIVLLIGEWRVGKTSQMHQFQTIMNLDKINTLDDYALRLGRSVQELSYKELETWVRAGKAPQINPLELDDIADYASRGYVIDYEEAATVLRQAIVSSKMFFCVYITPEGVYRDEDDYPDDDDWGKICFTLH